MKTKRTQKLMAAALVGAITLAVTALHPAPAAAQGSSESPLVSQMYNGQYPPKEDYAKFKDQLLFQRAVDAYMLTLPALNTIGMRDGSEAKFGTAVQSRRGCSLERCSQHRGWTQHRSHGA